MDAQLAEFAARWAAAELAGDVQALETLLTEDFRAVGPRGYVHDKDAWLRRYREDLLLHDWFDWAEVEVREYGSTAIAIGRQSQQSTYNGLDMDGEFRMTQFLTRCEGECGWRLAGVHLSPIAEVPAA
ncbi:nuclear transport factor 2 family protein [Streptomyces sp. NPDC051940]|uniref:nuclear transport factor 2 family protein n=1 Tax=Streptomyces sp. NPDC051940 TaxID=3155675 RepID=UPI00344052DA